LAFVVPTSDMLVKPSKQVDVSGLCRIDYIIDWEKKYEVRPLSQSPSP
jgi:ESCRT-I complex subunit TSG101